MQSNDHNNQKINKDINEIQNNNHDKSSDRKRFVRRLSATMKVIYYKYKKRIVLSCGIVIVLLLIVVTLSSKALIERAEYKNRSIQMAASFKPVVQSGRTDQTNQSNQINNENQSTAAIYIKERLQDISDELVTIRDRVKVIGNIDLSQQLASLVVETKVLSLKSDRLISQQIRTSTAVLQKQLKSINQVLKKLQKSQHPIKYLKPSSLPFTVTAIDNIQQDNVITIRYNHTTFPIEEKSVVAGWQLSKANFIQQKVEFIRLTNKLKQHVVVNLNHLVRP